VQIVFEVLSHIQKVIDDLIPSESESPAFRQDPSLNPLLSKSLKHSLPEAIINVFSKVHSRRFDFERQAKKIAKDRHAFEENIARVDAKLSLLQSLNGREGHADDLRVSLAEKREELNEKKRVQLEKEVTEQQIAIEDFRLKLEISQHENTVLKQTLDWVQERLDFYQKRWRQLVERIGLGWTPKQLGDFGKQVI